MAAHLLITACLIAEPHTCSEIEVPGVVLEDVVSCSHKSHDIVEKWQNDHKDQYLAIAAKCLKASLDNPAASNASGADAGGAKDGASGGSNGEPAAKPDDSSKTEPTQQ